MSGKGSAYLKQHIAGKQLTPRQAILAKCAECMTDYVDGRVSCDLPSCPLFPYQPYSVYKASQKKISGRSTKIGAGKDLAEKRYVHALPQVSGGIP
jgi:hypothetical protein